MTDGIRAINFLALGYGNKPMKESQYAEIDYTNGLTRYEIQQLDKNSDGAVTQDEFVSSFRERYENNTDDIDLENIKLKNIDLSGISSVNANNITAIADIFFQTYAEYSSPTTLESNTEGNPFTQYIAFDTATSPVDANGIKYVEEYMNGKKIVSEYKDGKLVAYTQYTISERDSEATLLGTRYEVGAESKKVNNKDYFEFSKNSTTVMSQNINYTTSSDGNTVTVVNSNKPNEVIQIGKDNDFITSITINNTKYEYVPIDNMIAFNSDADVEKLGNVYELYLVKELINLLIKKESNEEIKALTSYSCFTNELIENNASIDDIKTKINNLFTEMGVTLTSSNVEEYNTQYETLKSSLENIYLESALDDINNINEISKFLISAELAQDRHRHEADSNEELLVKLEEEKQNQLKEEDEHFNLVDELSTELFVKFSDPNEWDEDLKNLYMLLLGVSNWDDVANVSSEVKSQLSENILNTITLSDIRKKKIEDDYTEKLSSYNSKIETEESQNWYCFKNGEKIIRVIIKDGKYIILNDGKDDIELNSKYIL